MNQATQVLARKWRPKSFNEVVGQEHVLRVLTNALTQNRLHHAYIFTGTRGVGKTTIARIFAKCLNCEQGITATPCGSCDACCEIDTGRFVDLIEVDAASRTKVEDTRDLLENVQYVPLRGRYKIYLVDEVHMLSGHSFNALLKTLEEPPAHVIFLFATTDPQKLPITVLSRCLQLNLKYVPCIQIQQQLRFVLDREQIAYEIPAIDKLARAADGSVRDALSLLEQAIAFGNGKVIAADVAAMLGVIETTHIVRLLEALAARDGAAIFSIIDELNSLAVNFANVLEELLIMLHRVAVMQVVDVNDAEVRNFAQKFLPQEVQLYYQIGLIGRRDLPLAPSLRTGFEMIMLRMLAFHADVAPIEIKTTSHKAQNEEVGQKHKESIAPVVAAPSSNNQQEQLDLLSKLKLTGTAAALIKYCSIVSIQPNNVQLLLDPKQAALYNKAHEERLNAAFSEVLGRNVSVSISIGVAENVQTLAGKKNELARQRMADAKAAIDSDPNIRMLTDKFGATIEQQSYKLKDKNEVIK